MKYIQPVNRPLSGSLVAQVYTSLRADFGLVPEPLTLHSPVPYLLAGFWCLMREAQLVGRVSREIKEAVAAGVSAANVCPYCVEIHGTLATERGPNLALQIKQGRVDEIEPLALRQAVAWGQANLSPGADLLQRPPFTLSEAPEIIGTALAYHYINRMVRIFLGESLLPQPLRDTPLRDFAWPLVRWRLTGSMQRPKTSGTSLA
ncbi:MAG: alkylhydroperoxidase, partial [Chloroflexota bacterium]